MSNDKLVFTYTSQDNRIKEITDPYCDFKFQLEIDPSDMSTHQLFEIFSRVLAAMDYNEFSIMKGACHLAFNEMRDTEQMDRLIKEYELSDIPEEARQQRERKKMHESVNYSSKDNDDYEPA